MAEGMSPPPPEPAWFVVANMRPEPFGLATSPGTKHFVAGAKLHCVNWMWGMGVETVVAVGRHRGGSQLVEVLLPTARLTNFRAKLVYRPSVLRKLASSSHRHEAWTHEWCEEMATNLNKWFAPTEDLPGRKEAFSIALGLMRDDATAIALRDRALDALDSKDVHTIFVLLDFLEQHGARLSYDDIATTLRRQRDNNRA